MQIITWRMNTQNEHAPHPSYLKQTTTGTVNKIQEMREIDGVDLGTDWHT